MITARIRKKIPITLTAMRCCHTNGSRYSGTCGCGKSQLKIPILPHPGWISNPFGNIGIPNRSRVIWLIVWVLKLTQVFGSVIEHLPYLVRFELALGILADQCCVELLAFLNQSHAVMKPQFMTTPGTGLELCRVAHASSLFSQVFKPSVLTSHTGNRSFIQQFMLEWVRATRTYSILIYAIPYEITLNTERKEVWHLMAPEYSVEFLQVELCFLADTSIMRIDYLGSDSVSSSCILQHNDAR